MLKVEMLSTGDEVLHGQIIDTNAAWLADYFFTHGIPLSRRHTVGDVFDDLVALLTERSTQADILIVNGGLGPTSDDLSAQAAAVASGQPLVEQPEWLLHMRRFFNDRQRVMSPANRKQAFIPALSELIPNPTGTACGFAMSLNRCLLFFTPGVPSEFKLMIEKEVVPRICARFSVPPAPLCLRLTIFGRSESELAQQISPLRLPPQVVVGYRSSMPVIELKLTGPEEKRKEMLLVWQEIRRMVGNSLIFEGTAGLASKLAIQLHEQCQQLAVSEQFSRGQLYSMLAVADVPLGESEMLAGDCRETLEQSMTRACQLAERTGCEFALVVGSEQDDGVNFALHSSSGTQGIRVAFSMNHHELQTQREVCATMAQVMLQRTLDGQDAQEEYGWIQIRAAMSL